MTSKERVAAALAREPVDEIPLGFYAVDHEIIEAVLGRPTLVRNKVEDLLARWEGRRDDLATSYKQDTVEFFEKIELCDLLTMKEAAALPPVGYEPENPEKIGENLWRDKAGRIWSAAPEANYIAPIEDPTAGTQTYSLEDFQQPLDLTPPDPTRYEASDYLIEKLGADRYIMSYSGGLGMMPLLGGMEEGLIRWGLEIDLVDAAIQQNIARGNFMDQYAIRPGADGVMIEEDIAGTNGPLISPRMFEEHCLPALRARVAHIKQYVPQVTLHNCGDNRVLLDMIADAGVDCFQSLQTTAGMEIGALKEQWGDRLSFWGGVPVEVLVLGTPEDVRREVRTSMERGAGTGFILGPSHSIASGTSYDNFMAMLDEYDKLKAVCV